MDENVKKIMNKKVERTIENLKKNHMPAYFVQDEQEAIEVIKTILSPGDMVSMGGAMTMFETGIIDFLRNSDYHFMDRYAEGNTPEDIRDIYVKTFGADGFFTSSNAITEEGELYNVDGNGNRVAAMAYGPKKVIVVAGVNKIVRNIDEAIVRNREVAAPANALRLDQATPCAHTGKCSDCNSPDRICSTYITMRRQRIKDRIHVIIINKSLGY